MPCAQVLKLGLTKFVDVYGEKTEDYSTLGMKQAFSYYVDCRRPDNDKRARQLPEERRKQVEDVRDQLNKIGSASWSNVYIEAGGGTMYGLASVGAYATREDFMTALIRVLLNSGKPKPAARRRANALVNKARRALPGPDTPELESWDSETRPEMLDRYRSNTKEMTDAFAQLRGIIRALPDRAAELVARQMEDEINAGLEE